MKILSQIMTSKDPESDNITMNTGCTSCVCAIEEKEKKMYFANAGDSRAVLCKGGKVE